MSGGGPIRALFGLLMLAAIAETPAFACSGPPPQNPPPTMEELERRSDFVVEARVIGALSSTRLAALNRSTLGQPVLVWVVTNIKGQLPPFAVVWGDTSSCGISTQLASHLILNGNEKNGRLTVSDRPIQILCPDFDPMKADRGRSELNSAFDKLNCEFSGWFGGSFGAR
jgi:hypothetical protein